MTAKKKNKVKRLTETEYEAYLESLKKKEQETEQKENIVKDKL